MPIVAIHQPNYFPWLGYFAKIKRCDVFVFLDHVDFSDSSWIHRVKIKTGPDKTAWLSVPTHRTLGTPIRRVSIMEDECWRDRHLNLLIQNYSKTPYWGQEFPVVRYLIVDTKCDNLAEFNMRIVLALCDLLGIRINYEISSNLALVGRRSLLLLEITRRLGGNVYLSGDGARDYMDERPFREKGIDVQYMNFVQPEYPQRFQTFIPGLSILDPLFNIGIDGTRELL